MAILLPKDTASLLNANASQFESRSLWMDRFAHPAARDAGDTHPRRDWFVTLFKKSAVSIGASRNAWLADSKSCAGRVLIHAQLQSRLMVNMAGGVMENAGLCLDRFGLPYVPGSAVKGCARRAALAALHEWCETGQKPGASEADKDNLFKNACEPLTTQAEMLAAVARVFGWCEQDWSLARNDGRYVSDFAWACGAALEAIWKAAAEKLADDSGWRIDDQHRSTPWKSLPNFSGSVAFLPAHPADVPAGTDINGTKAPTLGKLELDVVTCHHGKYYAEPDRAKKPREWEEWNRQWGTAPDTEEPVPIVFPAVAPGHVFTFAVAPLRRADASLATRARTWLQTGLQTFGLGAKTNAGYGWFVDVTDPLRKAQEEARERQARLDRQAKEKADIEAARTALQPDPALLERLRVMKEPDLRGTINPFATEERFWIEKNEQVQLTLLHFLAVTEPGLLAADRANPKSKIAKAIANLAAKFPHTAAHKP
jgi:CRISPR/Cas system CMR subunit Cmr6 (Cas7 group RAMP superfamily)